MAYPRLILNQDKLQHNMQSLVRLAHERGVSIALVSKVVCADPVAVRCISASGADMLADSRIDNLRNSDTVLPKLLLRIGSPSEAADIVSVADISLESELVTLQALEDAASRHGKVHKVILMIDLGDLREGLMFTQWEEILCTARFVAEASHLELLGIGTNLTCYGSILPDEQNLGTLVSIAQRLQSELPVTFSIISGGNSTSVSMLLDGTLPDGINHLRLGESVHLGVIPGLYQPIDGLHQDVYRLEAELIEVQRKPSYPIGTKSRNAFGEEATFVDVGEQVRGILAIGRQDVPSDGLTPTDPDITILGSSSDHLIVDLTHAKGYAVGDVLCFGLSYGALLSASTSKYVEKAYE